MFATGGLMSVDPKTLDVYNEMASDYAAVFDNTSKPDTDLARFIKAMPKGGRVLDLGCGPGGASYLMAQAGLAVDALDASPEMVRLACEKGIKARVATFDDVQDVDTYDGVWANFSLLHAPREKLPLHFAALAKALRAGGHMHVGLKTGSGVERDHLQRLYTFVEQDELAELFAQAGLSVVATRTGSGVGLAGTDDPWVIMLGRKS